MKFEIIPRRSLTQTDSEEMVMGLKKTSQLRNDKTTSNYREEIRRKKQEYKVHYIFHEQQKVA